MDFSDLMRKLVDAYEAPATFLSGMVAQPVSGWAGLLGLPGGPDKAADITRKVQNALTYQPRGQTGRNQLESLSKLTAPLEHAKNALGDVGYDVAGPVGGMLGETLFTGGSLLAVPPGMRSAEGTVPNALYRGQAGMVKGPGGMWIPGTEERWGAVLGDQVKPDRPWANEIIRRYLNKHAGTEKDPLKDVVLPSGKRWEEVMDKAIGKTKVEDVRKNAPGSSPVLQNVPPGETMWGVGMFPGSNRVAGPGMQATNEIEDYLSHVGDYLRQNVPADKLKQYDLVRAVQETAKNDARVAKEMEKAAADTTAQLPVHKEYPDGMRWVELTAPKKLTPEQAKSVRKTKDIIDDDTSDAIADDRGRELAYTAVDAKGKPIRNSYTDDYAFGQTPEEAWLAGRLAEEGNQMGHCVGGYCEDVTSGGSKIYSLRDKAGRSHVTIEVSPPDVRATADPALFAQAMGGEWFQKWRAVKDSGDWNAQIKLNREMMGTPEFKAWREKLPSSIVQIKGKQNKAPNKEYLPYVQDFVRGGKWGEVGDYENAGLLPHRTRTGGVDPYIYEPGSVDQTKITLPPGYYTREELHDAYAKAGGVIDKRYNQDYPPPRDPPR